MCLPGASPAEREFLSTAIELGFHQFVQDSTRANNTLDLVLTSSDHLVARASVVEPLFSSDHNAIQVCFDIPMRRQKRFHQSVVIILKWLMKKRRGPILTVSIGPHCL